MKVIRDPDNFEIDCPRCKARLEIEEHDIRDDDVKPFWVVCEVCKREISIPSNQVPHRWKQKLADPH